MTPATALDEIERIASLRRRTSPEEPPVAYTNAYANLMLAYGYSKLGDTESARQLVEEAERALDPVRQDPIHAYLLAAFTAKIDQTIAGTLNLTDLLVNKLGDLDRVSRHKVDRLREASRILCPIERLDPLDRWIAGITPRVSPFAALPLADRPAAITTALTTLAPDDLDLLHDALDALLNLDQATTSHILTRALEHIHAAPEPARAQLYAKVMSIAEHAALPALLTEAADRMCSSLAHTSYLGEVLALAVPIASRNNLRREMVELLIALDKPAADKPALDRDKASPSRVLIAGCLAALGERPLARPIFDDALAAVQHPDLVLPRRLELVRAIAIASAELPVDDALRNILALGPLFTNVTDNYATNTHFCLSALQFIDSLVVAIVSTARPRDP